MSCRHLTRDAGPAPLWHRLRCRDCRSSRRADGIIALALACLRAEAAPAGGLGEVLRAVGLDPQSTAEARLHARRVFRRWALRILGFFGSLVLAGEGWMLWIDRDPGLVLPALPVPAVDGFVPLRAAAKQIVDDTKVRGLAADSASRPATRPSGDLRAQRAGLLVRNAPALASLREALKVPCAEPPVMQNRNSDDFLGPPKLASLLALEARVRMDRGDWAGAMASCLDAIELGRHIQHGGLVIDKLAGTNCAATGRANAWDIVEHLSAREARDAALRLARIRADHVPLSQVYAAERRQGQQALLAMFRKPGWRWNLGDERLGRSPAMFAALLRYSKPDILSAYTGVMDAELAQAGLPYVQRRNIQPPPPEGTLRLLPLPLYDSTYFEEANEVAQDGLLQVALGLRAYREAKGTYPDALADMLPSADERTGALLSSGSMPDVPADPFAPPGTELRYARRGTGYVLYSAGPDGLDDGGIPIDQPKGSHTDWFNAAESRRGDVVAGVNR